MKHILSNVTDSNGKIPVIGWVNPSAYPYDGEKGKKTQPVKKELLKARYEEYKLAGFNTVFCMRDPIGAKDDVVKKILEVCEELELGCILIDALSYTREIQEERLKEIAEFVKGYKSFKGLLAYDEPGITHFDTIGNNCVKFRKYFPDKLFYVNLLPNYATPEQLGISDYGEYVDMFIEKTKVNFLTYDHYPFVHFSYGIVNNDKYFKNLSAVRMRATEKKLPFMVFIETTAFIKNTHIPNRDEIMWQVNTALAYGAKGIQYFTYSMPSDTQETFSGALIARDGTRTASFDAVREVNARMRAVGDYLIDAESKGIIVTGVTPKNEFDNNITLPSDDVITSYGMVKEIVGGNTITGCFDNDGEEGYYLVNNDFTSYSQVTVHFKEKTSALVTRAEKTFEVDDCDKMEFILNAGEGVLIRIKRR